MFMTDIKIIATTSILIYKLYTIYDISTKMYKMSNNIYSGYIWINSYKKKPETVSKKIDEWVML